MDQCPEPGRSRRVVLQLGVSGPPAWIQPPRSPAERDGVVEAVELAGMVVEDEQAASQGAEPEDDGVGGEEKSRRKRVANRCAMSGTETDDGLAHACR